MIIIKFNTHSPLTGGHPCNQDTLIGPKGSRIRGSLLFEINTLHPVPFLPLPQQPGLFEFIAPLLAFEQLAAAIRQWRLHRDLVTSFKCLVSCLTSEQIYSKFVPLMLKYITGTVSQCSPLSSQDRPLSSQDLSISLLKIIALFWIRLKGIYRYAMT